MRGVVNNKMQQGSAVIVLIGLIAIVIISIAGYRYFEREQSDHTDSLQPTPTIVGLEEDVLPTPEYSKEWEEKVIEPRNVYKFRFPSEFEIWDYNPAITYIETDDFVRIGIEERNDGANIPFKEFAINSSNDWFQTQADEQSVLIERVSLITQKVSIMGYYDPGREVATTIGPRYVLLAHLNIGEYPIRVTMAAHCKQTGYYPTSPFRLVPLEECEVREYSELRQILLDILSTIQPV